MSYLEPKIYVACLAAYNNGYLHGAWINADQSEEAIYEEIRTILKSSPIPHAEEWAIHDHEDFVNIHLGENPSLTFVSEMANFIVDHGELGAEVLSHFSGDLEYVKTLMEDYYHGEYNNKADFAQTFMEEITTIPDNLAYYIDYDRMAQDWFYSGDFICIELNGKVHIFSSY